MATVLASIEEAIVAHLRAHSSVSALVGTRIYEAGLLAQASALPAITFQRIAGRDEWHRQDGRSGWERSRWQFTCYGARGCDAVATATAVCNALDGYRGEMGADEDADVTGINVGRAAKVNRMDLGRDPASKLYAHVVEVYITYADGGGGA